VKSHLVVVFALLYHSAASAGAQAPVTRDQHEAREIFQQLIEINTAWKEGSTSPAADAIARRFLAAGFPAADVRVIGPVGDKDSSVVVRFEGTSKSLKPILFIAHLDVVEALRSDWSLEPYRLTEKDGFFYGRGTSDIKDGAATLAAALLRMRRNHITPQRTLILALTAGEEGGGGYNGMDWLLRNHRDLIDAAFAINVDSGDPIIRNGKRVMRGVQTSEKLYQSFALEVTDKGGHSSIPTGYNAIARVSDAIGRVSRFQFPVRLTETTRAFFERTASLDTGSSAADMRTIAADPGNVAAATRLSMSPFYNAQLRTTCVPTMIEGGHAPNALPLGVSGVFLDIDDIRAHGRDERIMVQPFYDGVEYIYQLIREFAAASRG
jgi:acetylornithine deacetylase/succinyl-diaminopimelate desuccinylase-like protein